MQLKIDKKSVIVFDLDDTLYKEIEFLRSAFSEIAKKISINNYEIIYSRMLELYDSGKDVFDYIIATYGKLIDKNMLIETYRNHYPEIKLQPKTKVLLTSLVNFNITLGMITDGRSVTQRNKLKALGIEKYFKKIIISEEFGSEKPSIENYKIFKTLYDEYSFTYIGDNVKKDFITPNHLGWNTICLLDDGNNIHKQNFDLSMEYLPKSVINSFSELEIIYEP